MVAQRLNKIKLLFYVALTLNRNILIIFFSFLFFLSSFPFLLVAPLFSVLTLRFCPLPPTKSLPNADRSPNQRRPLFAFSTTPPPLSLLSHAQRQHGSLSHIFSLQISTSKAEPPSSTLSLLSHAQRRCGFMFVFSDLLWAVACLCLCGSGLVFSDLWAFWRH